MRCRVRLSGLGHHSFKMETGVRVPYPVLKTEGGDRFNPSPDSKMPGGLPEASGGKTPEFGSGDSTCRFKPW